MSQPLGVRRRRLPQERGTLRGTSLMRKGLPLGPCLCLGHIRQSRPDSGLGFQVKTEVRARVEESAGGGSEQGYLAHKKQESA